MCNYYEIVSRETIDYEVRKNLFIKIFEFFSSRFTVRIGSHILEYCPSSDVGLAIFLNGIFEKSELEICGQFVKSGSVVIDIGANIGFHSVYFSNMVQNGFVISFEPSADTFALLVKNIMKLNNVYAFNAGISNENRIIDFFESEDNAFSSLKDTKRKKIVKITKVICYRLDDLIINLNLPRIDFMKIDVEGHEQEVLEGMIKILEKYRPVILCEIYGGVNSNENPDHTVQYLISKRYTAFVIKNGELFPYYSHNDNFQNYLFIPSS